MEKRTIAERFGTGFAIELETMCKIKHHATVSELEDFIYNRLQTVFLEDDCAQGGFNMENTITIKGNVYFSGHEVDITDPCYDNDVVCRLTAPIEPGEYEYVIQKQLSNPTKNPSMGFIASLAIINSKAKAACDDQTTLRPFLYGVIGVDAGLAGFFENKPDYPDKEWYEICDYLKDKSYAEASLDNPFKCNGIVTSSGYGDGEYIVAQLRTEEGVVVGYRIDFI